MLLCVSTRRKSCKQGRHDIISASSVHSGFLCLLGCRTRGKPVALVKVPLHQLLQVQAGSSSSGDPAAASAALWFKASHTLQASFSDHLHCKQAIAGGSSMFSPCQVHVLYHHASVAFAAACYSGGEAGHCNIST